MSDQSYSTSDKSEDASIPVGQANESMDAKSSDGEFRKHAEAFLAVMPLMEKWSAQHINTLRSTVHKHLIPFFGSIHIKDIDGSQIERLRLTLLSQGLSEFRTINIVRAAKQIIRAKDLHGDGVGKRIHGLNKKSRKETNDENWMSNFSIYKKYQTNTDWADKQRYRYNNGQLSPMELELLEQINFPFLSLRMLAMPINMKYAKQLVGF